MSHLDDSDWLREEDVFDDDEIEEQRRNHLFEKAMNCTCGAWLINKKTHTACQIASCYCGAE